MKKFTTMTSALAVLDIDNIDTDQIIGSDHLKITNKNGLGQHLFSDWRYGSDGKDNPEFVLNQTTTKLSTVLVAGDNFGCGSSREHAPWALLDFGIQVVISSSIADIFYNNAIKNGLLPIQVSADEHQFLLTMNTKPIEINLDNQQISCEGKIIDFNIEPFSKYCLSNGLDQLDFLLNNLSKIATYEQQEKANAI